MSLALPTRRALASGDGAALRRTRGVTAAWVVGGSGLAAWALAPADWSEVVYLLAATAMVGVAGLRLLGGTRPVAWVWIFAGFTLSVTGDWVYSIFGWVAGREPPLASLIDAIYYADYAALCVGLALLVRRRRAARDVDVLVDVAAVAIVALFLAWEFPVTSVLTNASLALGPRLVTGGYPIADVVLMTLLAWLVVLERKPEAATVLLMLGTAAWLAGDIGFLVAPDAYGDTFAVTKALDLAWLLGTALMALASVHARGEAAPAVATTETRSRLRRILLALSLVIVPPLIHFVAEARDGDLTVLAVGGATLTLAGLAITRTVRISRARDRLEAQLRREEQYSRVVAANSADAFLVVDAAGVVTDESPGIARFFAVPELSLRGNSFLALVHPDDGENATVIFERALGSPGRLLEAEVRVRGSGRTSWISLRATNLLGDPAVEGIVINLHDVTARKAAEDQLKHQAFHDPLTGLANRALFRDRVEHALGRSARMGRQVAVMFCDLDSFKHVNDSLGHDVGDELLRLVAARLGDAVGPGDTIARLGGDEFAVLLEDSRHPLDDAETLADRLLSALASPIEIEGHKVSVGVSIGVAVSAAGTSSGTLLRNADVAMYRAKANGKGRWTVYDPRMRAASGERLRLDTDLVGALDDGHLRLVYQPIVDLATTRVTGFEALLRWDHPELGLIAPGRFIPFAEENGLIVPIGRWVLREACRTAARWQAEFPSASPFALNVNVSARQLGDVDLVASVEHALHASDLPAASLVLEVTETGLVRSQAEAALRLGELRDLGVRVAIDDFGTGYSSLSYLRSFPVDMLKIDRSFVATIGDGDEAPAIVRALIDLGRTLGLELVAEGIETPHQRQALMEARCERGQGYLFARPLDELDAEVLLATVATNPSR